MGSELKDISEADYRALEVESFSSLKYLLKGPKHYFVMKKTPFKGSSSTDFGTAIHHLLQGNKDYVAFMNKTNKEKYEEFKWEFMLKTKQEGVILQQSYKAKFDAIEKAFQDKPNIVELIKTFAYESAFVDEFNGVKLKGRIDGIKPLDLKERTSNKDCIIQTLEIKTYGQGCGLDDFRRLAYQRDYDMQAYMYTLFSGSSIHYFVAISTSEPFTIDIHPASDEFLGSGMNKLIKATNAYKRYVINKEPYDAEYEEL